MMRANLPLSDRIRSLPYFAQTLLACRFLRRVTLSLFMGSEKAIAIESAVEGKRNSDESRISQLVILSLLNVYQDPRFSEMQLTILLSSDLAQLSFVCQEAKLGPWDGMTNDVLNRLTPCHALELLEPPIAIEDRFR